MMSDIPCTPCRSTSSAIRKLSKNPASFATASSFSFGITITVSTDSSSSCMPRSACIMRRLPSKPNGRVTTATVRAPISLASEAITGAAPVPVPPPSPAVTNTMSAPSSASMILSESSSAARAANVRVRPRTQVRSSASPQAAASPAHSRSVSACTSVFAAMNSTPPPWPQSCGLPRYFRRRPRQ